MIVTSHERAGISGQHSYTRESALRWGVPQMQADFAAQPEKVQAETRARVMRILDAERLARRRPSALARIAAVVYGVRP